MKNRLFTLLAIVALIFPGVCANAADTNAPAATPATANDPSADLEKIVDKIRDKIQEGKRTEADLADNIKEMDALIAKYKDQKTDEVAQISFMKATLYLELFDNEAKATELLNQLKKDFPGTKTAANVDKVLAMVKQQAASKKIQEGLKVGSPFPEFDASVKDVEGKPLSIASFKGKAVMVDFWATWCGPCRGEVPNVVSVYQKYHDKGFEIIGVSLDNEDGKQKMLDYTKENKMTWRQYYDGKQWQNDLAVKYGVESIPTAYLLDGEGKIVAKDEAIRGEGLEPAVKKALGIN